MSAAGRRLTMLLALALLGMGPARADTILNAYGGPGGQSFSSRCPAGQYMVGLTSRVGGAVDQVGPICARWSSSTKRFIAAEAGPTAGGWGGTVQEKTCDPHFGVTQLEVGVDDDLVREIYFKCRGDRIEHSINRFCVKALSDPLAWILGGNTCFRPKSESKSCPKGQMAVGVHGRSGNMVDQLGLICAPFDPEVSSPIAETDTYFKPKLPSGLRLDACLSFKKDCGKPAADRYCQLRGRSHATKFKLEPTPIGGFSEHTYTSTTTMPIGDTRFCGADYCAGFHSITCACEPRPDQSRRFDAPRIESTSRRLDWCYLWGGKDCGQKPAQAFCVSKGFGFAIDFQIQTGVGREGPTQLFGQQVNETCNAPDCAGFAYIVCEGAYRQTDCSTGLSAKSYTEPCQGDMQRGADGNCRCPGRKLWNGSRCILSTAIATPPAPLPGISAKDRFKSTPVPGLPATDRVIDKPRRVGKPICRAPRPVGTPPNCCPLGTSYSNGACRFVKESVRVPRTVTNSGTGIGGGCPATRPNGSPPNCCPSGTYYVATANVCRRPTTITPPTASSTKTRTKILIPGSVRSCTGARPSGRWPFCCPSGMFYSAGACRRPQGGTNAVKQPGGTAGTRSVTIRGCPASRPVGKPPYCCPIGTSFVNGACRK